MRYILIILVFISVGAKAQMVIKAHANYRPYAQPAANLLLDDYPNAAAAYSLRKLDKDYTGAAIRVRKDTTGQPEQDIGFTISGDLDTISLKTFVGSNSAFVTTWYDQSGGLNNLTQSVQANQPNIIQSGIIIRAEGKVIIDFISSIAYYLENNAINTGTPKTIFSVYKKGAIQSSEEVFFDSRITNQHIAYKESNASGNRLNIAFGTNQRSNYTIVNKDYKLLSILQDGANGNAYINGSSIYNTNVNFGSNALNGLRLGSVRGTAGLYLQAGLYEFIIYGSNQSSNRTGIENNINDYYNIYWNGDFTGILDTYGSSAAAYSLRNLSSTYTGPLIRVRKDTTGQPEMDIYGDYYGNLDTVGLKSFLNARSGFVTTWYDQSGSSRNATQTVQANQPRIANLGVIQRLNSKPIIDFDGSNDNLSVPSSTSYFNFFHNGTSSFISFVGNLDAAGINQTRLLLENMNFATQNIGILLCTFGNYRIAQQIFRGQSVNPYAIDNQTNTNIISSSQFILNINTDADNATAANRSEIHINNGSAIKNNTSLQTITTSNATNNLCIGASAAGPGAGGSSTWDGSMQEILIYGSDQSSNRTGIRDLINTFYGIY